MIRDLSAAVVVDHTDGMRAIPDHTYNRDRTIHLRFVRRDSGFLVQAWGPAFPEDGAGGYQGQSLLDATTLQAGVDDLRTAWQDLVIDRTEPGSRPTRRPFVDDWDLSAPRARRWLADVGLELARAGHALFRLLFLNGDTGLKEITEHLLRALRGGEQVLTVESDGFFVPWSMLYVPMSDDDDVWHGDYCWTPDGFWGYRHFVEHGFSRAPGFDSRVVVRGDRVSVGLNVDHRVDDDYPPTPCVSPIVQFFATRAVTTVRTTKPELAAALQDADLRDQILYFGCHGRITTADGRAYLMLADDQKIYSTEVLAWLSERGLPTRPVVFVGACQGGQLASMFYPAFGYHLLRRGARSLVGPQIDLPRAFAREYATRLFSAFLEPHTKLGDIVRDLAREFLDRYHNPLGLIFSLYRGMDVHLAREPE